MPALSTARVIHRRNYQARKFTLETLSLAPRNRLSALFARVPAVIIRVSVPLLDIALS